MKNVIVALILFFCVIAQISWGTFMYIGGIVFPISVLGVWVTYLIVGYEKTMIFTFVAGIVVDALATSLFGYHSFLLMTVLTIMHLSQLKLMPEKLWGRIFTFCIGVFAYYSLIILINNMITVI